MKIIGTTRPLTNESYTYKILSAVGNPKVKEWYVEYNGDKKSTNKTGTFKFHISLASKKLKLTVVVIQNGKEVKYSTDLIVLAGIPKILAIDWRDSNSKSIGTRKVGYLDKVKLVIKTVNIPKGDTLKVEVFEEENFSDRSMGTYTTTGVDEKGYAFLYFNQLSLYQTKLNNADWVNESEHEYYVRVEYKNHINRTEEKIQLVVQNKLTQELDKPKPTNKPVVVQAPTKKTSTKTQKEKIDVVFNMFFDGTMNNMQNTTERIKKTSVYYNKSNKKDDSYINFYSNVALLYMNNDVKETDDIISIYTEGIGTLDKEEDQLFPGGMFGTSLAVAMRGIKEKVAIGLREMNIRAREKYFTNKKLIGKVTINVFGFSRGAAAARYFLSQEIHIANYLKIDKKDITFNFIGLFDTVASHGIYHLNDVVDLNLDLRGKPKKVIQLAAADEYRSNFKLTDLTSSIKAGVGYQLSLPGVHSDIGGGYAEWEIEDRYLGRVVKYFENEKPTKLEELKKYYIKEGWYREEQLSITKEIHQKQEMFGVSHTYTYTLRGLRNDLSEDKKNRGIPNTYQYISFAIMKQFSETYAKMVFKDTTDTIYKVSKDLQSIKQQLYDYAIANDGINSLAVTLPHDQLKWLRNNYLHRSNKDDEIFSMAGRYNKKGEPDRDVLEG
ncbi:phospholipase effector Tle1 domain-containing protein [Empedobacter tilapiae]